MAALDISLEGESCPLHLHFYGNTQIKQNKVYKDLTQTLINGISMGLGLDLVLTNKIYLL